MRFSLRTSIKASLRCLALIAWCLCTVSVSEEKVGPATLGVVPLLFLISFH